MRLLSFLLGVNKKARQPSYNLGGSLSEDKIKHKEGGAKRTKGEVRYKPEVSQTSIWSVVDSSVTRANKFPLELNPV